MFKNPSNIAMRLAVTYFAVAGGWTLFGYFALSRIVPAENTIVGIEIFNGIFFVLGTSFLLYVIIRSAQHQVRKETEERVTAEGKLHERNTTYRLLYDNSGEAILLTDPAGNVHAANPAACALFGKTEEELRQAGWSGIGDINDPRVIAVQEEHKLNGFFKGEVSLRRRDDETFPAEVTSTHFTDHEGNRRSCVIIRDLSERRRLMNVAREHETRFRSTLDSMLEGCQILDFDWRYIYINDAAEKHNRRPKTEMLGRKFDDVWTGIDTRAVFAAIRRCLEERIPGKLIAEINFTDGSKGCYDVSIEPVPEGAFILSVDITEHKHAEEQRRESEALYRNLVEVAPVGIAVHSNGNVVFANPAALKMFGTQSPHALVGKSIAEIVHPERLEAARERIARMLQGRPEKYPLEDVYLRSDGSPVHVQVMATELTFKGKPAVQVIIQDITEQKRLEERLRYQDFLMEAMGKIAKVGGWEFDPKTGKGTWTPEVARIHEVDPSDETNVERGLSFYQEEYRRKIEQAIHDAVEKGKPYELELELTTAKGTKKWVKTIGVPQIEEGKVVKVHGSFQDITEQKRIEVQQLRAQRLDSVGTLAGGIAHDLNNVLAPIMLSIEILKKTATDETGSKVLNAIETSARRGAEIIKQILTFTRGMEAKKTLVQTRFLINELVSILQSTFPRSITIRNETVRSIWAVEVNPTHFEQLLMNLCVNARDAMPQGGTLTISAENAEFGEDIVKKNVNAHPGKYVKYIVNDTGIGMSQWVMERMYDPFFTTKSVGKGTGLGLSTVYSIVKSYGGFIDVKSEEGKGTTFEVYLPAVLSEPQPSSTVPLNENLTGNGELVLIVDDEDTVREVNKETLEGFNYRVMSASNGEEAMKLCTLRLSEISVVLTDIMMPVMDGRELIRRLRMLNPTVKIVGSSGLVEQDEFNVEKLDLSAFLTKPYSAEELLSTIRNVVSQ